MSSMARLKTWTTDEYDRMIELGLLGEDDRVELVEGEIIEMAPIGTGHAAAVRALESAMYRQAGDRYLVSGQSPVRLSDRSEPQPDVALLRPRDDQYRLRHPAPEDVLLIMEVADSTLGFDRDVKLPAYARAGIAEAWLVDLAAGVIQVHTTPTEAGYHQVALYRRGEIASAGTIEALDVSVDQVVGG